MHAWMLAGVVLLAVGCGSAKRVDAPGIPRDVPSGVVAVVGAMPISKASFGHWLAIISHEHGASAKAARTPTVSFLVKAQWLLQEAAAESVNESTLNNLASEQAARVQQDGMTRADATFQARLNIISEALQSRHSTAATPVTQTEIAIYYAAHRTQFRNPAVRDTLMVVTEDHASALQAKAALASGSSWAAVAKRWSIDSSKLVGGAYAVVEGIQSPALVHAVFAAPAGRIAGPLRATPGAQPTVSDYYLFKVTGGQRGSAQPLAQVSPQIRQTLTEQAGERSFAAFTRAYQQRWISRTLCDPGYLVPECRNDSGTHGREP